MSPRPQSSTLFPYTTLFRSVLVTVAATDPDAGETGPDAGEVTFYRSGDTTASLTVTFSLTGSTATPGGDRKSTRLNSSHRCISYAVFCLKKKNQPHRYESRD